MSLTALATLAGFVAADSANANVPDGFVDELVMSNIDAPTNSAFLPDGRLLVVEQFYGNIRMIVDGAMSPIDPVGTVTGIRSGGEAGLLGIAVDPGWPARPYLYVHATIQSSPRTVRILRFRAKGDVAYTGNGAIVLDSDSRYTVVELPDMFPAHNGGTIRFGAGGRLFVTIGDDGNGCASQDLTRLQGKILRLDVLGLPDGPGGPPPLATITPPDNPFIGHPNASARLVWAYGLRNPFSFTIDPVTNCLYIGDVGEDQYEEIDVACTGGLNFGWPIREGPIRRAFNCPGVDTTAFVEPAYSYPHVGSGWAICAGPVYRTPPGAFAAFPPEYEGSYFLADTWKQWVRRLSWNGGGWSPADPVPGQADPLRWAERAPWITSLQVGPDGSLWYTQLYQPDSTFGENGVRRIRYLAPAVSVDPNLPDGGARAQSLEMFAPRPSPSRGTVRLTWRQARPGAVELAIFDAAGRRLRLLASPLDGVRAAGEQSLAWDGTDGEGRSFPAGIYFARLAGLGEVRVERLARVP